MLFHVYSLRKPVYRKEIQSVNLKTAAGEITILDNHRALITFLKKGPMKILDKKGKEEIMEVEGGFLEIRPNPPTGGETNILID